MKQGTGKGVALVKASLLPVHLAMQKTVHKKGGRGGALFKDIRAESRSFSHAKKRSFRSDH